MTKKNIKMRWEKVETTYTKAVYSLWYGEKEIASLSYYDNEWALIPYIYSDIIGKRYYREYDENEISAIQFHVTLEIMAKLEKIGNECFDYCNAISDYVVEYLENSKNEIS